MMDGYDLKLVYWNGNTYSMTVQSQFIFTYPALITAIKFYILQKVLTIINR